MKVQEVIQNLKYLISDDCTETQKDYVEEIEFAIKALEKQIPKKPTDVCTPVITCGKCFSDLFDDGLKFTYCPWCGQRIDWSDK